MRTTPRKIVTCLNCGTEKIHKQHRTNKYCSQACASALRVKKLNEQIAAGEEAAPDKIKRYIITTFGHQCQICKASEHMGKPIPLELDHIDGNSSHNVLSNCRAICPNCHAQTPTYKARNKGNGRAHRRKTVS